MRPRNFSLFVYIMASRVFNVLQRKLFPKSRVFMKVFGHMASKRTWSTFIVNQWPFERVFCLLLDGNSEMYMTWQFQRCILTFFIFTQHISVKTTHRDIGSGNELLPDRAPTHCLNQCWLIIFEVMFNSHEGGFARKVSRQQSQKCVWKIHI